MIKEVNQFMQSCPICGRPLQVCIDYLGRLVTCQHCRGQFVADSSGFDERESSSSAQRAARLPAIPGHRLGIILRQSLLHSAEKTDGAFSVLCVGDIRGASHLATKNSPSCYLTDREAQDMPTVLLVENRDDVFAVLADALTKGGVQTTRVRYATQAIRLYVECPTDRIVLSAEQPYESAWLLTAKLQLSVPTARICVHMSRVSALDVATSTLLGVDKPIESNGDISKLAAKILEELTGA
jgi:CheY-like chemotaxis protein